LSENALFVGALLPVLLLGPSGGGEAPGTFFQFLNLFMRELNADKLANLIVMMVKNGKNLICKTQTTEFHGEEYLLLLGQSGGGKPHHTHLSDTPGVTTTHASPSDGSAPDR
jgi:hypothetical protein